MNRKAIVRENCPPLWLRSASFAEVLPLWEEFLWPGRRSPIKPVSPIAPDLTFDAAIKESQASFWVVESPSGIVAANSGYRTGGAAYRSRGLIVKTRFRGNGLSRHLLEATVQRARQENCAEVWSLPRQTAWISYERFGFHRSSDWFSEGMEFGPNCLAKYRIPALR